MKKYKFQAKIEQDDRGGSYVFFPYDVVKEFGVKGRVPIQATFEGVRYRGSLIKYGHPQHMLPILKAIGEQIGKKAGESIAVEVWKDEEPRTVEVPEDLAKAMKAGGVLGNFEGLSYTHKREYCRWIAEAKKEETRMNRAAKAVEMLKGGIRTPDGPDAATYKRG